MLGLGRLVYAGRLGITLPDYAGGYASAEEQAEVASLIGQETGAAIWSRIDAPTDFDLLLFRHGRRESHIGICLSPGTMLHMATDEQPKLEWFDQGRWSARYVGVFRHFERFSKGVL